MGQFRSFADQHFVKVSFFSGEGQMNSPAEQTLSFKRLLSKSNKAPLELQTIQLINPVFYLLVGVFREYFLPLRGYVLVRGRDLASVTVSKHSPTQTPWEKILHVEPLSSISIFGLRRFVTVCRVAVSFWQNAASGCARLPPTTHQHKRF